MEALKHAEALLTLTAEHGFTTWHPFAQVVHGQSLAMAGRMVEAIAEIEGALAAYEATGQLLLVGCILLWVSPIWLPSSLGKC